MRVVVVGAGVIGLLTAIECVRAGARVDLVDQFDLPSPSATSNDRHRVVRALHRGDASLTRAAARGHDGWLAVQRLLGQRFYHPVGALTAMAPEEVPASLELLAAAGAPARVLSPGELAERYPHLRFPGGLAGVAESAAGAVQADRALAAMTAWLRDQPAVRAYPLRQVVGVDAPATVRLAGGDAISGDRVVVAAGPWSRSLLPAALGGELTLYRQSMLSYEPGPDRPAWAATPAIAALGTGAGAWLMPPVADTPVRLSASSACRAVPEMTDRGTPEHWREYLIDQFRPLLADFDPTAVVGTHDGYYLAADERGGPLLVGLGGGTVWAYAACGGMSFKFAPLIAGAIADRTLGRPARVTGLAGVDRPHQLATAAGESARAGVGQPGSMGRTR